MTLWLSLQDKQGSIMYQNEKFIADNLLHIFIKLSLKVNKKIDLLREIFKFTIK